jgi:hypothetical protein
MCLALHLHPAKFSKVSALSTSLTLPVPGI